MRTARTHPILRLIRQLAKGQCLDHVSDRELVRQIISSDEETAFTVLLRRHGPMVFGVCRRLLGNDADADDVFQATFLVLIRQAHSIRCKESLGAWLHGVAFRLSRRVLSNSARRQLHEASAARSSLDPGRRLEPDLRLVLDEELNRLHEKYRAPLALCYLEGKTIAEAGLQLGLPHGTVCSRLARGRERLRIGLTRRGLAPAVCMAAGVLQTPEILAAVPYTLSATTIHLAGLLASPEAAVSAGVSASVAGLVESAMRVVSLSKLKAMAAAVVAAGIITVGAGFAAHKMLASVSTPPQPVASVPPVSDPQASRHDLFGDPLPREALARLGTVRFRHGDQIRSMAFTPDRTSLAACGEDGIRVWDTATGKELRQIKVDFPERIAFGSYSPDGSMIAVTTMTESPVRLWDPLTGGKIRDLGNRRYKRTCFSPDGKTLAAESGYNPNQIELFEVASGQLLRSWQGDKEAPIFMSFMPDGERLLVAESASRESPDEYKVHIRDAASGEELHQFSIVAHQPRHLVLSPDGTLLAGLSYGDSAPESGIRIWEVASGKMLRQIGAPMDAPDREKVIYYSGPAFTPDGKAVAIGTSDGFVRLWDPFTGKELQRFTLDIYATQSVFAFSPDDKSLAVSVADHSIRLIERASGMERTVRAGHPSHVVGAVMTPDGRIAATLGAGESFIRLWDVTTGREVRRLEGHTSRIQALTVGNDSRTLFTSGFDKTIRLWDLTSGQEQRRVPSTAIGNQAEVMALSPSGRYLAETTPDAVTITDVATGKELRRLSDVANPRCLSFSTDGHTLIVCCTDKSTRLCNVVTGKEILRIPAERREPAHAPDGRPLNPYVTPAISPDGQWVAFGSYERFLYLHNLATGEETWRLTELDDGVGALKFSPDSKTLAWGGVRDGVIRLIEVATARERHRLAGHCGVVWSLCFSADGKRLISGSWDTTGLIWDLSGRLGADETWDKPLSPEQLDACWTDLAGDDAIRGYRAVRRLAARADSSVAYLRKHLPAAPALDATRVTRLIAELDSEHFETRDKAQCELKEMGEAVGDLLEKALKADLSLEARRRLTVIHEDISRQRYQPTPTLLRGLRAIEALESAGTPEARALLKSLSEGAPASRLTQEAKASLDRLNRRP